MNDLFKKIRRLGLILAGTLLVLLGIATFPIPGPWSTPIVLAGLSLLALAEVAWAVWLLKKIKEHGGKLRDVFFKKKDAPPAPPPPKDDPPKS